MATLDCLHVCTCMLLVLRSSYMCPRPSHVHPAEEVGIAEKTYERILDLEVTSKSFSHSITCMCEGRRLENALNRYYCFSRRRNMR